MKTIIEGKLENLTAVERESIPLFNEENVYSTTQRVCYKNK